MRALLLPRHAQHGWNGRATGYPNRPGSSPLLGKAARLVLVLLLLRVGCLGRLPRLRTATDHQAGPTDRPRDGWPAVVDLRLGLWLLLLLVVVVRVGRVERRRRACPLDWRRQVLVDWLWPAWKSKTSLIISPWQLINHGILNGKVEINWARYGSILAKTVYVTMKKKKTLDLRRHLGIIA